MDLEYCYLPPYSNLKRFFIQKGPDYQPIKLVFSFIKRKLKSDLSLYDSIVDALGMIEQHHLQS
jgi:hypothetical protein